jgi:copper homeostasis protein
MEKQPLLEICVETLDAALAAARGGADRIELCENLRMGGVTPRAELMTGVTASAKIPVFAMIRPRGGDFCYSGAEFADMKQKIGVAKSAGMNGLVFGILKCDGTVDMERNAELIELAKPLPVTFHRAFDETPNLLEALEQVITTGAARILTSGGKSDAEKGSREIADLVRLAHCRVIVMPGGGINAANLPRIVMTTHAREIHSGLSSALPYPRRNHVAFEAEVGKLAAALRGTNS